MRASLVCAYVVAFAAFQAWTNPANAQDAEGPIVLISKFYPTPGREDELQVRFLKAVEFVRKAEPKTVYRLHRSSKGPVVFLWYEVYESQAALQHHRDIVLPAFRKENGEPPDGIFARPAETEIYQDVSK